MRYIRVCVATSPPPPRKAKATMNCRASVVCSVTVPVSCLYTAAVPGGEPPPDRPPRAPIVQSTCLVLGHSSRSRARTQQPCWGGGTPPDRPFEHAPWCWVTDFVSCLDTADVPAGEPPPRTAPLKHRLFTVPVSCLDTAAGLVLGHSSRAGGGKPPRTAPSSTPLGPGSQILSRAWTQQTCRGGTPPDPPPRPRPLVLGHRFIYLFLTNNTRLSFPYPLLVEVPSSSVLR